MKKKVIIVTGSAGFIGFHMSCKLLSEGYQVIGIDNFNDYYHPSIKEARSAILRKNAGFIEKRLDISNFVELDKVFKEYKTTVVCHLAAQAGVRYSLTNPFAYEHSNLLAFLNILEMVRYNNIPRLVYASSSSVYGGNKNISFSEDDRVDNPISLYAATKKANELMAHCYTHLYGFQTIGLRFFTVYGPWGRPDMAMWLFAEAIKSGKKIKVFNYGKMKRDFTYVDDIIQGVHSSLFNDKLDNYEIFNLGNNKSENLLDMIALIEKELGIEAEKEMLPIQPGDVAETCADIDKARKKLGFEPKTTISKGIPSFIKWYSDNNKLVEFVANSRK